MHMRMLTRTDGRRPVGQGFSLLELLVALTILAIALVPVAYFYTKSLQMVEESAIRSRALNLAQERITEIEQMPYDLLRTNITPSKAELALYGVRGALSNPVTVDVAADDWFGYDFEGRVRTLDRTAIYAAEKPDYVSNGRPLWNAMFGYPLPLDFNPYDPETQGYNNAPVGNRFHPNNGTGDPNVNFFDAGYEDYEYEPIGFYTMHVQHNNSSLLSADRADISMADRRTLAAVEPALNVGSGYDPFRTGSEQQADNYAIYGRRTIILDVVPDPADSDGDNYAPDSEFDGGAGLANPYPVRKGPDNKFQVLSRHGTRGKLITVQVFWLPRKAGQEYIPAEDLNKIELKTFVAATNAGSSEDSRSGEFNRNDFLFITPPS
jgi:prepilin-type N-terminal cleavage/methylation domain-containing protein